jgi:hypothetical protein
MPGFPGGGVVGAEGPHLVREETAELTVGLAMPALSAQRESAPVARPAVQRLRVVWAEQQSSWTGEVAATLYQAQTEVAAAKVRGESALDPDRLANLRERYDRAVRTGIIHNRHRDWDGDWDGDGNHPAFTLATWLDTYAEQVWQFTSNFAVDWTSNAAERGIKPAKRHQAVSGYWHTDQTLNRWCLINSYLTSARNHGLTVLDAITRAQNGRPWLPTPRPTTA